VSIPNNNGKLAIDVSGLTKTYAQVAAVDGVTFQVRKGEIFGFLGPNGAGKTTTMRMLTGVIMPDNGNAYIMEHRAGSLAAKQVTGVVPEMSNAYGDLSGRDNLMLMANLYGITGSRAKEDSALLIQRVGLDERQNDPVKTYSKGMKQRLILAMAMISDPEILFLDEPTSGLDVQSARLINRLIRELNSAGKTIFLTTHDMDEANQLCHRVAIINRGKIIAIDAPEKLRMAVSGMHSVEVSFNSEVDAGFFENFDGVESVKQMGDKYRLYTARPGDLVVSLVNHVCSNGLQIVTLNILSPSLEDAFVALTERTVE
jgi:ABC-2 type transport system ATP-binding protein